MKNKKDVNAYRSSKGHTEERDVLLAAVCATYNIFTKDCECKAGYRGDGVDCISNSQTEPALTLPVIPP